MELLIVRHAIAFERDQKRWADDGERPLSPRGIARARRAAAGLRRLVGPPVAVLASPLARTRQTADVLTREAGWPAASVTPLLLPGSPAAPLLALIARTRHARVALVGHEPDLGRLLAACLSGSGARPAYELRKMGAALVSFAGAPRAGQGTLTWLLPPRLLRAARRLPRRG